MADMILSIDGGGIRGIIPAMILAHVEEKLGKPVSKVFDLIAGTSTGGIIALALTMPKDGEPAWRAQDLVDLYEAKGPEIFHRSVWNRIHSVEGVLHEKYPVDGLEKVLKEYLGETRLADALTNVIVPSYDIENRQPFFFKTAYAADGRDENFLMREAARATSAAPTYFDPFKLVTPKPVGYYALVDGGVFANNPAMCAWAELSSDGVPADAKLLSLGTGELCRPIHYADAVDWGLLQWARPILNVVMDGVSDATDYQLREMLGPKRYLRVTAELNIGNDEMDDTSATNIHALKLKAQQLIDGFGDRLDEFFA
jgi:uncharacterized protein